ncbi:MAG: hypothetical protein ACLRFE_01460, partial [Clostridia bacterium]
MKGKKLIIALCMLVALVVTGVCFVLREPNQTIDYANAEAIPGYTAKLNGGEDNEDIIFSAERVYFAVDGAPNDTDDYTIRRDKLKYGSTEFKSIYTNNSNANGTMEYFIDYALNDGNGIDYAHKDIIYDGEFVMLNDKTTLKAQTVTNSPSDVDIKQGVMITLGGYYFANKDTILTNTKTQSGDANIESGGDKCAGMNFVSVQAKLNGKEIEVPGARNYVNEYEDFTWFIVPSSATEGYYEISIQYSMKGFARPVRYDFSFYLLLQSSYDDKKTINSIEYSYAPKIENYSAMNGRKYDFNLGTSEQYPTLTYDYARYALSYTHIVGDKQTMYTVDYDESNQLINITSSVYEDSEIKSYRVDTPKSNKFITLMFAENGKYIFHFDYIYRYGNQKVLIPQSQIPFEDMVLNIYGYQLKYAKTGFASADMVYVEVYRNDTMFILVNGFTNADNESLGDNLGVQYKIENSSVNKTGKVKSCTTSAIVNSGNAGMSINSTFLDELKNEGYPKTDRGLWLTLNDEYYLTSKTNAEPPVTIIESYYYHNSSEKINASYVNDANNKKSFNKVTTFTEAGYYLLQVKYKTEEGNIGTQYFSFQITATTPQLELKTAKLSVTQNQINDKSYNSADVDDFYAYEYTNQNVFASWADTEIFESGVVGKLYYAKGKYASMETLKAVADGGINTAVTTEDYNKNTLIEDSAAYLLVLEVERSATRTYTYFTIDKEKISGLQVYEVATRTIDNRYIYSIKQDGSLNYINHTSKAVIDSMFTLDWANKASGARITATYKFTPFVKVATPIVNNKINVANGENVDTYLINQYTLGATSKEIQIQKPSALNLILDVNNVLIDQGIYEFNLIDLAGNKLTYAIVMDRTENVINATYGDVNPVNGKKPTYISGQMVADYVELEWGTHKAIKLTEDISTVSKVIRDLINSVEIEDYYNEASNFTSISSMFTASGEKGGLFVVLNKQMEIKLRSSKDADYYYIVKNDGTQQKVNSKTGVITTGWDEQANTLFSNVTKSSIKVNVDTQTRRYTFEVLGGNQVSVTPISSFAVYITPDKAMGEVYSSLDDRGLYETKVYEHSEITTSDDQKASFKSNIGKAQASNHGVFVFEWLQLSKNDDGMEVTEVKYDYYQLMDQNVLNTIDDDNYDEYPYYPYKQVFADNYILQFDEDGNSLASAYTTATRIDVGGQTKEVYRSNPINLGYETYYEGGNLVSRQVTQTGLYIITRTLSTGDGNDINEMSYAFFVDRNMIVGYSLNDVNQKIVGQFIHASMPNSERVDKLKYSDFNKQGLKQYTATTSKGESINYKIYLETNKLPTQVKVPTGKYVSGNYNLGSDDYMDVYFTSYNTLNLRLTIYFKDTYQLLQGEAYKGAFIPLMSKTIGDNNGYINFNFKDDTNEYSAEITVFKNSRKQTNDNMLSLPGEYIFVIEDTVSWETDEYFHTKNCNKFTFAVKLTNNPPKTDVYAYAKNGNTQGDKLYANEENVLYTNQEFVDFVIPVEDKVSYQAQLDIASIAVWRINPNTNEKVLWLKTESQSSPYSINQDGIVKYKVNDGVTYIEEVVDKTTGNIVNYIIHVDTGLKVEDGVIVDYKEYIYEINISYITKYGNDNYLNYYYYNNTNFNTSTYTVIIDRTPNNTNLDALMTSQNEYFEQYQDYLAERESVVRDDEINNNFAYRSTKTVGDYYGLTNSLYYQFATQDGKTLSNEAMFALSVNNDTVLNLEGLKYVYYREIDFDATIPADKRMGLLPITSTYWETSEYYGFNENQDKYHRCAVSENGQNQDLYKNIIFGNANSQSKFYEVVEKDLAGNYTQYVIYFSSNSSEDINVTILGTPLNVVATNPDADGMGEVNMSFTNNTNKEVGFVGINEVVAISGIVDENPANSGNYNPYYSNINIYNGDREKISTIYTNSLSVEDVLKSTLENVIKEQGNFLVEYINTFNQQYTITINNYHGERNLSTALLKVETEPNGQDYVVLSQVNTIVDGTIWYVTKVEISYSDKKIVYNAQLPDNGISELVYDSVNSNVAEGVVKRDVKVDRLNLQKHTQYIFKLTDIGGNTYSIPISTSDQYWYRLETPTNTYANNNIYYTSNQVILLYNKTFYETEILVYIDGKQDSERVDVNDKRFYEVDASREVYDYLILKPDDVVDPANSSGQLRRFKVKLTLKDGDEKDSIEYDIYIDTRAIVGLVVENLNKEDKISSIKSTLKNGSDGYYEACKDEDLINHGYYGDLITETINLRWDRMTSDYFIYDYKLLDFENATTCKDRLSGSTDNEITIKPGENPTGKYVLRVDIRGKDNTWIATRIYAIYMSTTITGLYEVKDINNKLYPDYSSITNISEIRDSLSLNGKHVALGFENEVQMNNAFASFGEYTAIPMYISNVELVLTSNKDNGVNAEGYSYSTDYATITFYHVWRSNYLTFVVLMSVNPNNQSQDILNHFKFTTKQGSETDLLKNGTAVTIYDSLAEYYRLSFGSYNQRVVNPNPLEKHNKIIIDVYYNSEFAKRIKGDVNQPTTSLEFKNSGSYRLEVRDEAGNIQYFRGVSETLPYITIVVMRRNDMLYTINGSAPIQYAYYDSDVTLQINRYNEATGKNNYDINSIGITVIRNSREYTGYQHPAESATYIFKEYGTYLVTMTAKILNTNETVTSQLVFTIINPNEARQSLDFTSIYGYNIISVFSISKTAEKDVTDKFMDLLKDKANIDDSGVYNRLITYERVVEAFKTSTQGKMKFRVLYEVENDDLLPARLAEFTFTLNNEEATINSSIEPGGKTTKPVVLKFNPANLYDQVGECSIVVNGEVLLRIDENSQNAIAQLELTEVGEYYVQLMGDSGNIIYSFNFTIKEPLNTVSIILIVVIVLIVGA